MDSQFILVTGVVVFGLCFLCPVSSSTGISNESSIEISTGNFSDVLKKVVTENSKFVNKSIDLVNNNFMDIVINHNFTGIVIDNATTFFKGNFTKYIKDNNTEIKINFTGFQLKGPFVCMFLKK